MNINFFKSLVNSKNPQAMIEQMISQNPSMKNNPLFQNALCMMRSGDMNGLETMARNLISSQGENPDEVINNFKKMVGSR